jgi:hypothetical protein
MQALEERLQASFPIYQKIWTLLKGEEPFPFSLSTYQHFLGFREREKAVAVLESMAEDAFQKHPETAGDFLLAKDCFLQMARKRRNADPWVRDLQLGYKAYLLDQKARKFEHFSSPTPLTAWDIAEETEGNFYAYKLNTLQLAQDLELDPQQLFDQLNQEGLLSWAAFLGFRREAHWIASEQEFGNIFIPYASFNSLDQDERARFFEVLEFLWHQGGLSPEQSTLLETLAKALQDTLTQQRAYEEAKKIAQEEAARREAEAAEARLRKAYKAAARLCHPDLHTEDGKKARAQVLFQQLNQAYQQQDFATVQATSQTIQRELAGGVREM